MTKPRRSPWKRFIVDLFTDGTGETWAIGRIYSIPVLVVGLAIPVIALYKGQPIAMVDVGVLLAGIAGACLLLIRGANEVDLTDPAHPRALDAEAHHDKEPPQS